MTIARAVLPTVPHVTLPRDDQTALSLTSISGRLIMSRNRPKAGTSSHCAYTWASVCAITASRNPRSELRSPGSANRHKRVRAVHPGSPSSEAVRCAHSRASGDRRRRISRRAEAVQPVGAGPVVARAAGTTSRIRSLSATSRRASARRGDPGGASDPQHAGVGCPLE